MSAETGSAFPSTGSTRASHDEVGGGPGGDVGSPLLPSSCFARLHRRAAVCRPRRPRRQHGSSWPMAADSFPAAVRGCRLRVAEHVRTAPRACQPCRARCRVGNSGRRKKTRSRAGLPRKRDECEKHGRRATLEASCCGHSHRPLAGRMQMQSVSARHRAALDLILIHEHFGCGCWFRLRQKKKHLYMIRRPQTIFLEVLVFSLCSAASPTISASRGLVGLYAPDRSENVGPTRRVRHAALLVCSAPGGAATPIEHLQGFRLRSSSAPRLFPCL
mmetsp:Transcript_3469/g.8162  ORF Transcript_3469/g.8162 Transcript_3469/m.8162 type:complete len:274 (-) Transcript_3469:1069-1890(-)